MVNYKPKVTRRRKRREKQREFIRNIVVGRELSEESTDDNDVGCTLNVQVLPVQSTPPSYSPIHDDDQNIDSFILDPCMSDEDDVWIDDVPNFNNDQSPPLYKNARISVNNAITSIIDFSTKHHLHKSAVKQLFKLVKCLLPNPNVLPTTHGQILKSFGRVSLYECKFYCNRCDQLCKIQGHKKSCDNSHCILYDSPLKTSDISEVVILDIASQLRHIIGRNFPLLATDQNLFPTSDIKFGEQYIVANVSNQPRITFNIHSDGAPLVRTTKSSLWPVFASIVELPPQVREFQDNILVFALWTSRHKPKVDLLMKNIIEQLLDLAKSGLRMIINGRELFFDIQRQMFIADLPAKALFLKTISFNGYFACTFCMSSGIWKKQVLYPYDKNNNHRRTHDEVLLAGRNAQRRSMTVDGIKGVSSMLQIFTYPDQIIFDYMHLICLGHMLNLIKRWLTILPKDNVVEIDTLLHRLRLPHNMSVNYNYSMREAHEWHAKHLRLFVLNVGLPCVTRYLPKILASHFAVYSLAIKLLHCPRSSEEINLAQSLIDYYCRAAPKVYDESIELLSLHAHLHLADQVRRHGGLSFSSAFCFESCIRHVKKMAHGTRDLASQIAFWCDFKTMVPRQEFQLQPSSGKNQIYLASHRFDPYRDIFRQSVRLFHQNESKIYLYLKYKTHFITYHSFLYDRPFTCSSYIVSYKSDNSSTLEYGNIIIFYQYEETMFAFVQRYQKSKNTIFDFLDLPQAIAPSINENYPLFYLSDLFVVIPVSFIQHKCVSIPFDNDVVCLSEFRVDFEHD